MSVKQSAVGVCAGVLAAHFQSHWVNLVVCQSFVFVNQSAMVVGAGVLAAHFQSKWAMSEAAVPNMFESICRRARA